MSVERECGSLCSNSVIDILPIATLITSINQVSRRTVETLSLFLIGSRHGRAERLIGSVLSETEPRYGITQFHLRLRPIFPSPSNHGRS